MTKRPLNIALDQDKEPERVKALNLLSKFYGGDTAAVRHLLDKDITSKMPVKEGKE